LPRSQERFSEEFMALHKRLTDMEVQVADFRLGLAIAQPSDVLYRRLYETSPDGILILDGETDQIIHVNPALLEMVGYSGGELVGKRLLTSGPFQETALDQAAFDELKNKGYLRQTDLRIKTKGGPDIPVEFVGNVYLDEARKMIQCNVREISARHKTVHALPKWENRNWLLAEIIERSLEPVGIAYPDGSLAIINKAFSELIGYTERELYLLKLPGALTPREWQEQEKKMLAELRLTKKPVRYEKEFIRRDGTRVPVELLLHIVEDEEIGYYYYAFIKDLTRRKLTEAALQKSEERFSQVSANAQEWIWEVDNTGLYTYASPAAEKILGYRPEEIVGQKHFYDFFVPEERQSLTEAAFAVFESKAAFRGFANTNVHKDGRLVFLETSGSPILDEQGNLLGYRGLDTDVTDRKQAEIALRESEERFKQLAENIDHVFWFIQLEPEKVLYVSSALEKIWGFTVEELYRNPKLWAESIHPEDRNRVLELIEGTIAGPDKYAAYDVEYRIVRKDGALRWIHDYGVNLFDKQGKVDRVNGIAEDITARKEAEQALRQIKAELEIMVADRTRDLAESNLKLQAELVERKLVEKALKRREAELQERSRKLEEMNIALKVLLKRVDEDKKDIEKKLTSNVKHLIAPYIEKLRKNHLSSTLNETYLNIIETQLNNLFSPFSHKLSSDTLAFTPREIQVADLIREGRTSKEIADILHISKGVADFHRDHIRAKLGIKNHKGNLRTHLLSIR